MPIDPSMLAKSIGTLTDLHPERELAETLQQAVITAKQLFDADAAGVMLVDLDGRLRWASASTDPAHASPRDRADRPGTTATSTSSARWWTGVTGT